MVVLSLLQLLWLLPMITIVAATASPTDDFEPTPLLPPNLEVDKEIRHFVSATLGSNMVLQRDTSATLWGFTHPGATITTTMVEETKSTLRREAQQFLTTADMATGLWRQHLPPHPASLTPTSFTIKSTSGETATLDKILFGDVYICGGQSNMQFSIPATANATQEAKRANDYPHIRLFTVGQGTRSDKALLDLQTIEELWAPADEHSVAGGGTQRDGFSYFSSVCWFFGREVADGLDNKVPIGLISNNWGGTRVELWQPGGDLYNAMIHPYMVGPMSITGFTWYQGEANTGKGGAKEYAHLFPEMIQAWRKGFHAPKAFFGFVQLSTWCPKDPIDVAEMRQAQLAALQLDDKIGYATNADHGAGCDIHPPPKQYCGARLGHSALALQYGQSIAWKSPSYLNACINNKASTPQVVVQLQDVSSKGLYLMDDPYNRLQGKLDCNVQDKKVPSTCAWGAIQFEKAGWVNATIAITAANEITLTAMTQYAFSKDDAIVATSYGFSAIPMMTIYDTGSGLPALPWQESLSKGTNTGEVTVHCERGRSDKVTGGTMVTAVA